MASPTIVRTEHDRQRVLSLIAALDLSKPWSVLVKRFHPKRTLRQNALMWMWNSHIAQETGGDEQEVHEGLKELFCPPKPVHIGPKVIMVKSTKLLDTKEEAEYLDRVQAYMAAEFGILLPLPEEMQR